MIISRVNFLRFLLAAVVFLSANKASADGILFDGKECKEVAIEADPSKTYTFIAQLPYASFASIGWSADGGIEIVSQSTTTVTIRSKSGMSYSDGYSRYSRGRLTLSAVKQDPPIPEGCEQCLSDIVCNPYYHYSVVIYKMFDWGGNAIVGDKCAQPGDSVTFSVAPWVSLYQPNVVGFDTYEWEIPSTLRASDLYYSADKSSVTFVASENIEGQVIKAKIGKYNIEEGSQPPLSLTLSNGIPKPIIEGMGEDDTYCLPFATSSASLVVSNSSADARYVWKMRTWDILSLSANGDTVTFRPQENEQVIQLQVEGGCTDQSYLYQINRSLPANASIASSFDNPYCLPANKEISLSVSGVPVGTSLDWHIDGEGWVMADEEKNKAVPAVRTGIGSATVSVKSSYCPTPVLTAELNIEPQKPLGLDGPICVTWGKSEALTYSIPPVVNAAQYEWSFPAGWSVSGASNQNTISLISDGINADSVAVRAIGCNETEWVALAVNMEYPAPQGITQKSPCLNPGYSSYIELEVVPPDNLSGNVAYEWQIPSSLGIWSGGYADGSIVRIRTTGNLGYFPVSVSVSGSCGESSVFTDTIYMNTGFTLNTEIYRKKRQIEVSEELNDVKCYTWYVNGRLLASGPDESYVDFGQNSEFGDYFYKGNAYVIVEYTSGCRAKMSISWDDIAVKRVAEEIGNKSLSLGDVNDMMLVSPNPANGTAKVSFQTSGDRRVAIVSRKGEVVSSYNVSDKVNSISLTDVTPGLYFVVATDGENKYCSKLTVK